MSFFLKIWNFITLLNLTPKAKIYKFIANLFKTQYCSLRLNSKYLNWFSKLILLLIFSKIAVFIFCLKHFDFDNSVSRKVDSPSNPLSISTASLLLTSAFPVIHPFAMSFMVLEPLCHVFYGPWIRLRKYHRWSADF